MSLPIIVVERPHVLDQLTDLTDPEKNSVPKLGIIGVDITDTTAALLPELRIASGVLVAAREEVSPGADVPLITGDVIHAVNRFTVRSLDGLRVLVDDFKSNSEVILQIERNGHLLFVTCQIR